MKTLFTEENMTEELNIDGNKDAVLLFRDEGSKQEVILHLPPFITGEKEIPTHVCVAVAIAACVYHGDTDFQKLIGDKFEQYGEEYLTLMSQGEFWNESENTTH
jgi:hypothetical protein